MKIIDVDISELERARRRGRARSPETLQLIEAIESLKPRDARGIAISDERPEKNLRARLAYAAKISGKRLGIASDGDKVMFTLSDGPRRRRRRRSA